MPKINVYLPDELAARVKDAGIPISRICQTALTEALEEIEEPVEAAVPGVVDLPFNARVTGFVDTAVVLATRRGSAEVETADLLRGLIVEDESLILHALENAGFTRDLIADTLARHHPVTPDVPQDRRTSPRLSAGTRTVLAAANREAHQRNSDVVNGSHVLMGMLEDDGAAGTTLRELGVQDVITPVALSILSEGIAYGRATSGRVSERTHLVALADIAARLDRIERHLQDDPGSV